MQFVRKQLLSNLRFAERVWVVLVFLHYPWSNSRRPILHVLQWTEFFIVIIIFSSFSSWIFCIWKFISDLQQLVEGTELIFIFSEMIIELSIKAIAFLLVTFKVLIYSFLLSNHFVHSILMGLLLRERNLATKKVYWIHSKSQLKFCLRCSLFLPVCTVSLDFVRQASALPTPSISSSL